MNDIMQYWSFSVWLISLNIMPSKSIHIATNSKISFYFMAEWYSVGYIYHIFFIYSSVYQHLGCFHILTIGNSAAVNIGMHVSFQISVLVIFRYVSRSGILGSNGSSILDFFEKTSLIFTTVAVPVYITTNIGGGFPFLHIFTNICYLCSLLW